jgi:hypothetical protein
LESQAGRAAGSPDRAGRGHRDLLTGLGPGGAPAIRYGLPVGRPGEGELPIIERGGRTVGQRDGGDEAAEARCFHTAERRAQVPDLVRVDRYRARLDPVGHLVRPSSAKSTASSSVSNGVMATTGPKISSWKIRAVRGKCSPIPEGWWNSGNLLVDKTNVDEILARQQSPQSRKAWFRKEIDKQLATPPLAPLAQAN